MVKETFTPGTLFAVPLPGGRFGVGLLTHIRKNGRLSSKIAMGCFFRPLFAHPPGLDELVDLNSHKIALFARFGCSGFVNGGWARIAQLPCWDPKDWPSPIFSRIQLVSGKRIIVRYSADDPSKVMEERAAEDSEVNYAQDGLYGQAAIEIALSHVM